MTTAPESNTFMLVFTINLAQRSELQNALAPVPAPRISANVFSTLERFERIPQP